MYGEVRQQKKRVLNEMEIQLVDFEWLEISLGVPEHLRTNCGSTQLLLDNNGVFRVVLENNKRLSYYRVKNNCRFLKF